MQLKDILLSYAEWLDADQHLMARAEDGDHRTHEDLAETFLADQKFGLSSLFTITDDMLNAYEAAWSATEPVHFGARRRAGLKAVFDLLPIEQHIPQITGPVTINSIVPESDTALQLQQVRCQYDRLLADYRVEHERVRDQERLRMEQKRKHEALDAAYTALLAQLTSERERTEELVLEKTRLATAKVGLQDQLDQMKTWRDNAVEEMDAIQIRCAEYLSQGCVDGLLVLDGVDCSPKNVRDWMQEAEWREAQVRELQQELGDERTRAVEAIERADDIHTVNLARGEQIKKLERQLRATVAYAESLVELYESMADAA